MINYNKFGEKNLIGKNSIFLKLKKDLSEKLHKKLKKKLRIVKATLTRYRNGKKKLEKELVILKQKYNHNSYLIDRLLEDIKDEVFSYDTDTENNDV